MKAVIREYAGTVIALAGGSGVILLFDALLSGTNGLIAELIKRAIGGC